MSVPVTVVMGMPAAPTPTCPIAQPVPEESASAVPVSLRRAAARVSAIQATFRLSRFPRALPPLRLKPGGPREEIRTSAVEESSRTEARAAILREPWQLPKVRHSGFMLAAKVQRRVPEDGTAVAVEVPGEPAVAVLPTCAREEPLSITVFSSVVAGAEEIPAARTTERGEQEEVSPALQVRDTRAGLVAGGAHRLPAVQRGPAEAQVALARVPTRRRITSPVVEEAGTEAEAHTQPAVEAVRLTMVVAQTVQRPQTSRLETARSKSVGDRISVV